MKKTILKGRNNLAQVSIRLPKHVYGIDNFEWCVIISPSVMKLPVCVRALCRIKFSPVTHVLVDTWMVAVKPVYKLSDVPDDLK